MFKHYWPEEDNCDKCGSVRNGSMLYMGNFPVYFVCEVCDPKQRHKAITFSLDLHDDVELNGWEWQNH